MSEDLTRKLRAPVPVHGWLTEPLHPDVATAITRLARAPDVHRVSVMPDVHLGEGSCIGVALATNTLLYPQAVGSDIGCGISAFALNADGAYFNTPTRRTDALHAIAATVPILKHASIAAAPPLPLAPSQLSDRSLTNHAARDGRIEFGTLGRGNHFLELQADQNDQLWLVVHSGSRAMGQIITAYHDARTTRASGGLRCLDAATGTGRAYLADVHWAVHYARGSREHMLHAAASALNATFGIRAANTPIFGTTHNHVQLETHDGRSLLIHRKGASPAAESEDVIIPGSMAGPTFFARGRGCSQSLQSSSHGAGRVLSRSECRRSISPAALLATTPTTFDHRFAAHLVEEAPAAYRDIRRVMRAQRDLVRITHTLTHILCLKGV